MRSPSIAISVARAKPTRVGHEQRGAAVRDEADVHEREQEVGRLSAATIRSQASASEQPMPTAGPLTAAITGFGISRIAGDDRVVALAQRRADVRVAVRRRVEAAPSGRRPRRSARPAPVSTTARTPSSAATLLDAPPAGRRRTARSTRSCVSGRLSSICAARAAALHVDGLARSASYRAAAASYGVGMRPAP